MIDDKRFNKQIEFIVEIDRLKDILRRTKLFDSSRHENDAEHAWHLSLMAIVLGEYSNEEIDPARVIKMVLIHDIVEIDAGDTFLYAENRDTVTSLEKKAAERIFGLLPEDLYREFYSLWNEFEEGRTKEAKFAAALDRLQPVMQNYYNNCYAWRKHGIKSSQIIEKNMRISEGSKVLWDYASQLISECVEKGCIE